MLNTVWDTAARWLWEPASPHCGHLLAPGIGPVLWVCPLLKAAIFKAKARSPEKAVASAHLYVGPASGEELSHGLRGAQSRRTFLQGVHFQGAESLLSLRRVAALLYKQLVFSPVSEQGPV